MPPGISSAIEMVARKRSSNGAQPHNKGPGILITAPLLDAIRAACDKAGSQKAGADLLGVVPATITNILNGTQKSLKSELYVRVCERLGFETSENPMERMLFYAGQMSPEAREQVLAIMKTLALKR